MMPACEFRAPSRDSQARLGVLRLARGTVATPAFMPVGTLATVKAATVEEVAASGAEMILANTYHLYLRPGTDVVARLGGLHTFMNWHRPILTDSGGYQVFSLAAHRKITEDGALFRSHLDGSQHLLTPETVMAAQEALGSDIRMVLDECPALDMPRDAVARSMELTTRWALRCLAAPRRPSAWVFAIVQGGLHEDLRAAHAAVLREHPFDGFALGGLSVGEPPDVRAHFVRLAAPLLPPDRPRYLMGVGTPLDIYNAVEAGIDMFDCVLPTRNARNGQALTWAGKINIGNQRHTADPQPLDGDCRCPACRHYSRGYLHHLHRAREILGHRLLTLHNLHFMQDLMARLRAAIAAGDLAVLRPAILRANGKADAG